MSFTYAKNGLPYGFGWMSTLEMENGLKKYLKRFAICESFTDLQDHSTVPFRVLFMRNHYICIIRCSDCLYYFDSLGPVHLQNLIGFDPPEKNTIAYQQSDSATCGAFVCFVAAVYSAFDNGKCNSSQITSRLNYFLTPDVIENEFNIVVFVASQGIGEEFATNNRYQTTKRIVTLCASLTN